MYICTHYQLALALADLALQMQSWTSVVSDLIGRFSSDMSTVPALLDVLIVLPEEVTSYLLCFSIILSCLIPLRMCVQINNRSLHLGHNRRKELKKLLGGDCLTVLQLLVACLQSFANNPDILTRVRQTAVGTT